MAWRQFVMDLGALDPERVEELFSRHGAQAITFSDAGDDPVFEPNPGETPLWPASRITGLFAGVTDLEPLKRDLLRCFDMSGLPTHSIEDLPDREWAREWLKDFLPMRFGRRLWVAPTGFAIDARDAVVVRLDPGLAFGTGSHPTTALCLRWLDAIAVEGKTVLDFGCGSGILAIAALRLGARSASALDTDPQALVATRANARKNGVWNRLFVTQDVANLGPSFDIVVANILAEPLIRHVQEICDRVVPGGLLGLSGILVEQARSVADAYASRIDFGLPAADRTTEQTWIRLAGKRI